MNLQKEFKKETGMNAYINRVGKNTMYHQSYTKWLETKLHEVLKLNIPGVIESVCDDTYHKHCKLSSMQYKFCPECGIKL